MIHTIVALVEDKPGVFNRIANLWRHRQSSNICSLNVGRCEKPGFSRMTFTVDDATTDVEQVTKQMLKIIEVHSVADLTDHDVVHREMALAKVAATPDKLSGIFGLADIFRARIVDVSPESLVFEVTGAEGKVDAFIQLLGPFGIIELVRTGKVAMTRGPEASLRKAVGTRTSSRR